MNQPKLPTIRDFMAKKAKNRARRRLHASGNSRISKLAGTPQRPNLSVSRLKKILWTYLSLYIRLRGKKRTGGVCEVCHIRPIEVSYHILPAGDFPGTRFDVENLVASCVSCNYKEYWHRSPEQEKWRTLLGPEQYDRLIKKGRQITKWSRDELKTEISRFKKLLAGGR